MKRFLLLAGRHYYPEPGTADWVAEADSRHELEIEISPQERGSCIFKGQKYDWYEIVDLDKHSLSSE